MNRRYWLALLHSFVLGCFISAFAETKVAKVEIKDGKETTELPDVSESRASKKSSRESARTYFARDLATDSRPHYLAIHLGTFVDTDAYKWGARDKSSDSGKMTFGVSYRVGELTNALDFIFRADFNTYELSEGKAQKLSLMPVVTFPDAASRFPLYFGAGIGPGIFFKQISEESSLSLDYELMAGARFFDVFDSIGFFMEAGLKNHILLLSDGQFNGVFFALGSVFTF